MLQEPAANEASLKLVELAKDHGGALSEQVFCL